MSGIHQFGMIMNIIGGVLIAYGYVPQIYTLLKTKNVGNNSIQYWSVMTFGIFCIGINQFINNLPLVQLIAQSVNISLAITVTVILMVLKTRENNKGKHNNF